MVAQVGQNETGTSALEFFEINVRPRTCATDPLMVSSDDWRGRGVAADFAVIGQLRTGAAKSSWFMAEEDAKMAQRH